MEQRKANFKKGLLVGICLILALGSILDSAIKFRNRETIPSPGATFTKPVRPAGFRFAVGAVELLGAFFLLSPRTRFRGAAVLGILFAGILISCIVNKDSRGSSLFTVMLLMLTGIVAWAARPSKRRDVPGERHRHTGANQDIHPINNYFTHI